MSGPSPDDPGIILEGDPFLEVLGSAVVLAADVFSVNPNVVVTTRAAFRKRVDFLYLRPRPGMQKVRVQVGEVTSIRLGFIGPLNRPGHFRYRKWLGRYNGRHTDFISLEYEEEIWT